MKLTYTNEVDEKVNSYGFLVKTGDVAEMPAHLAQKAVKSGNWEKALKDAKVNVKRATSPISDKMETLEATVAKLDTENKKLSLENNQLKTKTKKLEKKIAG
jgi:predicted RNase H-like nuclease (RuvC/YqgF family)